MLHKRCAKIDNHKSKRLKIENIFETLYNATNKQTKDTKQIENINAEVNISSKNISTFEPGMYINYNNYPKVNCTITNSKYIDDLVEYFDKCNYYKSLSAAAKIDINNEKIYNIVCNNMDANKIVNVTTIYIDYPFYTTITIDNKYINDVFTKPKSSFDFNLRIYRELLSKDTSQIGQIENLLKTGDKEKTSEKLVVDFYNILIFLYKIIFDSDSSFITKRELLCFIKNHSLSSSIYTDKFIHMKTNTYMNSLLYLLLENIKLEYY